MCVLVPAFVGVNVVYICHGVSVKIKRQSRPSTCVRQDFLIYLFVLFSFCLFSFFGSIEDKRLVSYKLIGIYHVPPPLISQNTEDFQHIWSLLSLGDSTSGPHACVASAQHGMSSL